MCLRSSQSQLAPHPADIWSILVRVRRILLASRRSAPQYHLHTSGSGSLYRYACLATSYSLVRAHLIDSLHFPAGTVRENLDPFHEHSDQELLEVLEKVQIAGSSARTPSESKTPSRVPSLANLQDGETSSSMLKIAPPTARGRITLDTQVSQGGSSLSAGQRQLLA